MFSLTRHDGFGMHCARSKNNCPMATHFGPHFWLVQKYSLGCHRDAETYLRHILADCLTCNGSELWIIQCGGSSLSCHHWKILTIRAYVVGLRSIYFVVNVGTRMFRLFTRASQSGQNMKLFGFFCCERLSKRFYSHAEDPLAKLTFVIAT